MKKTIHGYPGTVLAGTASAVMWNPTWNSFFPAPVIVGSCIQSCMLNEKQNLVRIT